MRENPSAKSEIKARALACRLLDRLGMNLEPIKAGRGRPAGMIG